MELIELLKKEQSHGTIDAIYNKGKIVPVGVAKVFELIIKSEEKMSVDICPMLKADYDNSVFSGIKNYLDNLSGDIIKRYRVRAKRKIIGELPDANYKGCHIMFGNREIIAAFGGISRVFYIHENDSVEVIDETNDHIRLDRPVYFGKEELSIILRNM